MTKPGAEIIARPEASDLPVVAVPGEYTMFLLHAPGTGASSSHPGASGLTEWRGADTAQRLFRREEEAFARWFLDFTKPAG